MAGVTFKPALVMAACAITHGIFFFMHAVTARTINGVVVTFYLRHCMGIYRSTFIVGKHGAIFGQLCQRFQTTVAAKARFILNAVFNSS